MAVDCKENWLTEGIGGIFCKARYPPKCPSISPQYILVLGYQPAPYTNFLKLQVRSSPELPWLKAPWERLPDTCAANPNFSLAQTGAAATKLRKSRIPLLQN